MLSDTEAELKKALLVQKKRVNEIEKYSHEKKSVEGNSLGQNICRSSHLQMFFQKGVLKKYAGKHLCWSLFLIKKRDSKTGIFP